MKLDRPAPGDKSTPDKIERYKRRFPGNFCRLVVNTLSAKADSFFEHPTQRRGYAQLARSRPCAIKDINRRVIVPIQHQTATAPVNAHVQVLRHVRTAGGTLLARVVRGHLFNLATGPFSLVGQYCDEGRPSYIAYRSGKPGVPDHPLDVQAFHSDLAVARNQIIRDFVAVFVPQIGYAGVQPSNPAFGLLPVPSAFLLARKAALSTAQFGQRVLQKMRVFNFFALGCCGEVRQPYVDANRRKDVADLRRFWHFACHSHKPFVAFALQGNRFDSSLYFPVQAHANRADILNAQAIAGELDSIAVLWKKNRVKPVSAFESRVTWRLTGFNSSKEVGKRLVKATQRSLSAGEIEPGKPNILFSFFFKPSGLVFVAARHLPFVVEPLPLSQRIVVEPPVCLQHNGEFTFLVVIGPQSEFVRFVGHLGLPNQVKLERVDCAAIPWVPGNNHRSDIIQLTDNKSLRKRQFHCQLKQAVALPS